MRPARLVTPTFILICVFSTAASACYLHDHDSWAIGCEPPNFTMPINSGLRSFLSEKSRLNLEREIKCGIYKDANKAFCESEPLSEEEVIENVQKYYDMDDYNEDKRVRYCYRLASKKHIDSVNRLHGQNMQINEWQDQDKIEQDEFSYGFDRQILSDVKRIKGDKYNEYQIEFSKIRNLLDLCLDTYKGIACERNGFGECKSVSAFQDDAESWNSFGSALSGNDQRQEAVQITNGPQASLGVEKDIDLSQERGFGDRIKRRFREEFFSKDRLIDELVTNHLRIYDKIDGISGLENAYSILRNANPDDGLSTLRAAVVAGSIISEELAGEVLASRLRKVPIIGDSAALVGEFTVDRVSDFGTMLGIIGYTTYEEFK